MMLLISSDVGPESAIRLAGLYLLRPESDLTEHAITQLFHNTKVTKVKWGRGVFTEWVVG